MSRWQNIVLHDYGITPSQRGGVTGFNPYNVLVMPGGRVQTRSLTAPAPHAVGYNRNSLGVAWGGPVGSRPDEASIRALRQQIDDLVRQNPGAKILTHGEADKLHGRGLGPRASVKGRGLDEASGWIGELAYGPPRQGERYVLPVNARRPEGLTPDIEARPSGSAPAPVTTAPVTTASVTPTPIPSGPQPMAQPVTPYSGMLPDDVQYARAFGGNLMQQGTSAAPVGHWTQALARALQAGSGAAWMGQAAQGQRQGQSEANAVLAQALQGGTDPRALAAQALANPWTQGMGQQMVQGILQQQTRQADPMYQQQLSQARAAQGRADALFPLQRQQLESQLAQAKSMTPEGRAAVAPQYGLQPGTPEHRQFVLMGTLPSAKEPKINVIPPGASVAVTDPRSGRTQITAAGAPQQDATTKKEIAEADDFIQQTQSAVASLQKALQLNRQAYAGAGAQTSAWLTNNTVGNIVDRPGALATDELSNVITNQALASLRATFGGNPTEGERKILLDVAGSVSQPREVRRRIYESALQAAQKRLRFNEEKARRLRAGTYYQPGGQPTEQQQAGPSIGAIEDGWRFKGGDPSKPSSWERVR